MNFLVYLVLWIAIGLMTGFITHWILDLEVRPWFWAYLAAGMAGALLAGYALVNALFGMPVVLSAFSLIFALLGAVFLVLLLWACTRKRR